MIIDFHSHILPACDHGSSGLSTSQKQIELSKNAGVDILCATSHFYPDRENVSEFLARRDRCFAELIECRGGEEANKSPKILLGAEVLACAGLEKLPNIEALCLEGTNILLVEMPFARWHRELFETIEAMAYRKDVRTVLAHADRYEPCDVEAVLDLEIPVQLNVESLSGLFVKKHLKDWIDRGVVVALGSDMHGTDVGYRKWEKAKSRLKSDFDDIMEKTNKLIFG